MKYKNTNYILRSNALKKQNCFKCSNRAISLKLSCPVDNFSWLCISCSTNVYHVSAQNPSYICIECIVNICIRSVNKFAALWAHKQLTKKLSLLCHWNFQSAFAAATYIQHIATSGIPNLLTPFLFKTPSVHEVITPIYIEQWQHTSKPKSPLLAAVKNDNKIQVCLKCGAYIGNISEKSLGRGVIKSPVGEAENYFIYSLSPLVKLFLSLCLSQEQTVSTESSCKHTSEPRGSCAALFN